MSTPHCATPEQWADQEKWAIDDADSSCILELRARIEALEAGATCPHIVSSDEGTSYCRLAEQNASTVKESLTPAPAGSLVERVACAMHPDSFSPGESWAAEARVAIRVIAGELRAQCFVHAADWLHQEADR